MTTMTGKQFRPLPVPSVDLGGFWGEWQESVCDHTAGILLDRCIEAGMLEQLDIALPVPALRNPMQAGTVNVQMFWDSDLGKVIETIAYSLYRKSNPALEARADAIIALYEKLQGPDGYVNSWYQRHEPDKRWTNLRDCHELYCAGHMMEGAVAYFQATGKRQYLDIMCRYADYLVRIFGKGPDQMAGYCGHEEIELALVKLARATGEQRYLDLAKFFIDERGQQPYYFDVEARRDGRDPAKYHFTHYDYNQAHVPVREQTKVVGHAVRAMYLYSGMADIATEYHDDALTAALETLWDDLTLRQMYVTGGIGPSAANEGFTDYYDLPNESAYAETCASVGLVFWASRMLGRKPNRRFADIMEVALYNGALSGLARDGKTFFYENPLESGGRHHRWIWHRCPCCPPNIARLVTSIGSYIYGVADDEIAVHLYAEGAARIALANGAKVTLTQQTRYPWDGAVGISLDLAVPAHFTLSLRVPGWTRGATLLLNGAAIDIDAHMTEGYVRVERQWASGDVLALDLPMAPRAVRAHPKVRQDAGRAAVMRGPLVYCLEGTDNQAGLNSILLQTGLGRAQTAMIPDFGGAIAIDVPVLREAAAAWEGPLYQTDAPAPATQDDDARLVPYHLWDNRQPGEMLVWMRTAP